MTTRKLILTVLLIIPLLAFSKGKDKYTIVKIGDSIPEFTFIKDDTLKVRSTELKGKVVLINFFAFWCPPCKKELPMLESAIWNKHKDNDKFELLVVGRGHKNSKIKTFFNDKGYSLPYVPDSDKEIFNLFAKDIIPRSYVIDKNGVIVYQALGYNVEDFKKMVVVVDSLLLVK